MLWPYRIIRPRGDGTWYRACPKCSAELNIETGEWVPAHPHRMTHGYQVSQLFSSRMDPGEILREYRRTRFPERFYNLKIGKAWADTANRLDASTVLALCGEGGMLEGSPDHDCTMGVDTGSDLHVVISRFEADKRRVVYLGVLQDYAQRVGRTTRFPRSENPPLR